MSVRFRWTSMAVSAAILAGSVATTAGTALGAAKRRPRQVALYTMGQKKMRRGREFVVQASVPKGALCRLTVAQPGGSAIRSAAVWARSALAQFEWKVPADTKGAQRLVTVACASDRARLAHRRRVRSRSVLVAVAGRASRHGARRTRIRVLYPVSHAQPITGKGGGAYPHYGTVIIPGRAWLGGQGVNVYSDGMDGGSGYYQCVELINRLITTLHWSPAIWGNANQLYGDASSAYFDKHPNGSGYKPVPGDIIVWGGGYGGFGHVQVVNANNGGSLTVVEQNASPSGYNVVPISASGAIPSRSDPGWGPYFVEGILHPKADTLGQTPVSPPPPVITNPTPPSSGGGTTSSPPSSGSGGTTSSPPSSGSGGTTSSPPSSGGGGTTTSPPPPAPTYSETAGGVAHTWTNYTNAGGYEGPDIGSNQTVQIACKITGFRVADGNTWWYRIASSPWDSGYYVSADAFYNDGATSGSLHGTPFVDPAVPNC